MYCGKWKFQSFFSRYPFRKGKAKAISVLVWSNQMCIHVQKSKKWKFCQWAGFKKNVDTTHSHFLPFPFQFLLFSLFPSEQSFLHVFPPFSLFLYYLHLHSPPALWIIQHSPGSFRLYIEVIVLHEKGTHLIVLEKQFSARMNAQILVCIRR